MSGRELSENGDVYALLDGGASLVFSGLVKSRVSKRSLVKVMVRVKGVTITCTQVELLGHQNKGNYESFTRWSWWTTSDSTVLRSPASVTRQQCSQTPALLVVRRARSMPRHAIDRFPCHDFPCRTDAPRLIVAIAHQLGPLREPVEGLPQFLFQCRWQGWLAILFQAR